MLSSAAAAAPTLTLSTTSYNVWPGDLGQRCENTDIPDTPITFVKLTNSQIAAYSGNGGAPQHRWIGATVDTIERECAADILPSPQDCDASRYSFDYWVGGMASVDGALVASVDMEYHGWECNNCSTAPYSTCWMNANLIASAEQSGAIGTPALVKPPHQRYVPDAGPYGSFLMSNVIKGGRGTEKGGFWYALAGQLPGPGDATQKAGLCTFRSATPAVGSSWTMWDGARWVASDSSPYDGTVTACAGATNLPISGSGCSVRWSTFYSRWIVVGTIGATIEPRLATRCATRTLMRNAPHCEASSDAECASRSVQARRRAREATSSRCRATCSPGRTQWHLPRGRRRLRRSTTRR